MKCPDCDYDFKDILSINLSGAGVVRIIEVLEWIIKELIKELKKVEQ
jgi:hypothetical protein